MKELKSSTQALQIEANFFLGERKPFPQINNIIGHDRHK